MPNSTPEEIEEKIEELLSEAREKTERLYNRIKVKLSTSGFILKTDKPMNVIKSGGSTDLKVLNIACDYIVQSLVNNNWSPVYRTLAHELGHGKYNPITIKRFEELEEKTSKIVGDKERARRIANVYSDCLVNYALFNYPLVRDDYETGGLMKGFVLMTSEIIDDFIGELTRYLYFIKQRSKEDIYTLFPRLKEIKWRPYRAEQPDLFFEGDKIFDYKMQTIEEQTWKTCPWADPLYLFFMYLQYMVYIESQKKDLQKFLNDEDVIIWWKKLLGTNIDEDLSECYELLHHYYELGYKSEFDENLFKKTIEILLKYDSLIPRNFENIDRAIIKCDECGYIDIDSNFSIRNSDIKKETVSIYFECSKCKKEFTIKREINMNNLITNCHYCSADKKNVRITYKKRSLYRLDITYHCDACNKDFAIEYPLVIGAQCPYCLIWSTVSTVSPNVPVTEIKKIKDIVPAPSGYITYATFYCKNCENSKGELIKPIGEIRKGPVDEEYEKLRNWFIH